MADELIIEYYRKAIIEGFRNLGDIEDANASAMDNICPSEGDLLSWKLKIERNRILDIKYKCGNCDPAAVVAAEILGDLAKGLRIDEVSNVSLERFSNALGGYSEQASAHFVLAMQLLNEAISNYTKNTGHPRSGKWH